jgi:hypothetical protein
MSDAGQQKLSEEKGLAGLLTLGMLAGVAACVFVLVYFHEEAAETAKLGYHEEAFLTTVYDWLYNVSFVLPVGLWIAAVAVTGFGRSHQALAKRLIVTLFAFAALWPAGAWVAYVHLPNNLSGSSVGIREPR